MAVTLCLLLCKKVCFNFLFLVFFEIHFVESLHLTTLISQNGIHGEVTFFQDPLSDGKIISKSIYVTVNLFNRNNLTEDETWTWYISEFPVDYSSEINNRCSNHMIGNLLIDLGNLFGPITFLVKQNQTYFEFQTGNETFSLVDDKGIWGHTLVLLGPSGQKSCGTISVTDEYEERVAEAKFYHPISGSVYFRWAGSYKHNVTGNIIFSNLVHTVNHNTSQHGWKIFVTDILDSEADKSRKNCDFLQIVLNHGTSNLETGDLTSHLGKVTVVSLRNSLSRTSKSIFRDQILSSLTADLVEGSRSLYLVLFDDRHNDSFLACSKIRYHRHIALKAVIQAQGVLGFVTLFQRTRFDPTWLFFNISSMTKENNDVSKFQINEFPLDSFHSTSINSCSLTGELFNPTKIKKNFGSQDKFPVGDLSGKHGHLRLINSVISIWDINLPLFGPNSVVHRSLVLYSIKNERQSPWVCGTLHRYSSNVYHSPAVSMFTASVVFRYPLVGSIVFRQPKNQPWIDTTVIVEYLIYADGTSINNSFEHHWSVNENPPGKDFFNWTGRCLSAGDIFNPYKVNLSTGISEFECLKKNRIPCRVGDLSRKIGFLDVAGSKKNSFKVSRKLFTDTNLPLTGLNSIVGKSIVIYDDFGPVARGNRLACSKILPIYRRKAVAKSWHGNGEPTTVFGKFEFIQQTKFDITNIFISIGGLNNTKNYNIHVAPVQENLEFPCEDSTIYEIFNPRNISPINYIKHGTPDFYKVGDLSEKFENFENKTTVVTYYNDTSLTLFGPESILGRSIVIRKQIKNRRWACSSIERGYAPSEAKEIKAIASFHQPGGFAYGYIKITQLVYNDGSKSDSTIEVKLRHPGKQDRNITKNHNWAIYVNPVSVDASVKATHSRCTAGGYIWNPYYTQLADPLNEELYKTECGPDNPLRCYIGDISSRLGTINIGDKRQIFSDVNFPLDGKISAMGRSIVIFTPEKGRDRFACANIEHDKDIIKFANIRRTPRFEAFQFLKELREVMGVPDWFITIDSRKTKVLYNGNCVQFLIHFKGPIANKLEQDFSILMATGQLNAPSLYIPGYNSNSKHKNTISHKACSSEDPLDKIKNKNKNFFKNSSIKIKISFSLLIYICFSNTL